MQALADFSQGIPIPEELIRSALEHYAAPGYTGTALLDITLTPNVAECVRVTASFKESHKIDLAKEATPTKWMLPDPKRKKPVESAMKVMKPRLVIRPVVVGVEAYYLDGMLDNYKLLDVQNFFAPTLAKFDNTQE